MIQSNPNLATISESEVAASVSVPSTAAEQNLDNNDDDDNNNDNDNDTAAHDGKESAAGANSTAAEGDDDDDDLDDESPLWSGAKDGWHLSWPIWHLLPHHERKSIAQKYGYKSIGAFEEYMSLQQAVDNSELKVVATAESSVQKPDPNEAIYGSLLSKDGKNKKPSVLDDEDDGDKKPAAVSLNTEESDDDEEEDDDDDGEDEESTEPETEKLYGRHGSTISSNGEELSLEELMVVGGKLLMLSDELLHKVFSFLPVDTYGTLALVSPHWKHLTRTETVYKRLCERLYLNQSKRRQLHVSKFGGSYRRMLEVRPRVRAAGGCYVLKYTQIKKIQRDMWTEVPVGAILESIYYRYMYFQEDGRVLYALSSSPPHEMFRRLLRVALHKSKDPAAVWGTFQVQNTKLTITARQEWHTVQFDLTIHPDSSFGRFAALSIDKHLSSPSGCFEHWSNDRVQYDVPNEQFRFVADRRL
ncbi:MAG: hypothetical protein SGILL_000845 [Bacillariaceae sp.]